ncbi:MAG: chromosome segregation protein SMC [Chitinispirillaceae bacterium]|nr:chromosome segregation protein SMC [Chitinispirillaceae bacterium]
MILRKLSIFGFKSFAEKTELEFGEGITAVIGPNGCGKSNVVDAIRWVLGEQKVTLLRSTSMQDIIFSGTQQRQPLNMAEVILTIENDKGILPVEYSEVAISRRIFRNGESEYRLNKVPCRLRDIHNLFLDTGVGSSAYTTIERGMIDSILSDKAEERRILFEEASGIGKYKQRRKESLRQLERTRQDLLRINDQVQEVDRQVRMLARHVEKARRYKTYRDDLKVLELGYWTRQFRRLDQTLNERKKQIDGLTQTRELLRARIAAAESHIEKMRLAALEKEKDLETASRTVSEENEKIIALDRDQSVALERLKNVREHIEGLAHDVIAIDNHIDESSTLRAKIEKCIIEREGDLTGIRDRLGATATELGRFDVMLQELRDQADALAREQIRLINTISESKNTIAALKSNLAACLEQRERNSREAKEVEGRIEEYREAVDSCVRQLSAMNEENSNLLLSREQLLARLDREDARYQEFVEREKRLEAQTEASLAQLRFLEGLDASYEGYETGVKELLTGSYEGVKGTVADLIRVQDEACAVLVEKALGPAVQAVVFDTEEHLAAAVDRLCASKSGAACMIALDRIGDMPVQESETTPGTSMRALLQPHSGYEGLSDHLFAGVMITDSGKQAITFSREHGPAFTFIGRDGVVCGRDGMVVAGESKREQAGLLQRKLRIEQLMEAVGRSKKELDSVLHDKDICIITRDEAKKALVEVDEKLNRGQRCSQEQQTNIRHYESVVQTAAEKTRVLQEEATSFNDRIRALETEIAQKEAGLVDLQTGYDELEIRLNDMRAKVRAMEDERRFHMEHAKNVELEEQGLSNRIGQDRQDVERLTKEIERAFERKQHKTEERQKADADVSSLEQSLAEFKQKQEVMLTQRAGLERVRDTFREEYNARLVEIEGLRKEVKIDLARFEQAANQVHEIELLQTRDEQEQRRIRERMWETYEADLGSGGESLKENTDEDEVVLRNIDMLRERIKRVGEVNMAAFEDYETESARLKDLSTQRDDLQKSVDGLDQAIRKLDKEARAQFLATLEKVQRYFSDMFTTLFEGGEAYLHLEENVDPLEATIHINVRPAGKKMRSVQMLSAGERALTAISLLFALYLVKPSAYCILDELDAPLDEANTVRFIKALDRFTKNTQFVVITHNKRTMEAADVLYGVTQREFGVSTVMSVRIDDAVKQAA